MSDIESLSSATLSASAGNTSKKDNQTPSQSPTYGGHKEIADMMAYWPVAAIVRRFGTLNMLNILHLQAELARVEGHLQKLVERDRASGDRFREQYCTNFDLLADGKTETGHDQQRWQLLLRIRRLLREYNEAVIQNSQMLRLSSPQPNDLAALVQWMTNDGNNQYTNPTSADHDLWFSTDRNELLSLAAREHADPISSWLWGTALDWYHRALGRFVAKKGGPPGSPFGHLSVYDGKPVARLVSLLAVAVSSLGPIISIVVLNALKDKDIQIRLAVVAVFTVVFCIACAFFTGAKKTDLLAASGAFAAVQVVFVSGNNDCQC